MENSRNDNQQKVSKLTKFAPFFFICATPQSTHEFTIDHHKTKRFVGHSLWLALSLVSRVLCFPNSIFLAIFLSLSIPRRIKLKMRVKATFYSVLLLDSLFLVYLL